MSNIFTGLLIVLSLSGCYFATHGFCAAGFGSAWNGFFPPDDLYERFSGTPFKRGQKVYEFDAEHIYPGDYKIDLFLTNKKPKNENYRNEYSVLLEIFQDGKKIHSVEDNVLSEYYSVPGPESETTLYGNSFCRYHVPRDIPARQKVKMRVTIKGDIDPSIPTDETSRLSVIKQPDL